MGVLKSWGPKKVCNLWNLSTGQNSWKWHFAGFSRNFSISLSVLPNAVKNEFGYTDLIQFFQLFFSYVAQNIVHDKLSFSITLFEMLEGGQKLPTFDWKIIGFFAKG